MDNKKLPAPSRARIAVRNFITGGEWAIPLPAFMRNNLYMYWFDGVLAAASDTIPITYLTLYMLTIGATGAQVGLLSSLTSLAAAIFLLPGAFIVERFGRAKDFTVIFGGIGARLGLLVLALLPLFLGGQALIWSAIGVAVIRSALGNVAFPAWMSITGEIVPMEGRGRYFGSRNFAMGIATIAVTYLAGEWITRMGSLEGYQIALAFSFALGIGSAFFFSRIQEPQGLQRTANDMAYSLRAIWADLRGAPAFLMLCLTAALWNFSINVSGPFYTVYMSQDLEFTAAAIGLASIATSLSRLLTQRKLGELADRLGAAKVQIASMFLLPILPMAWLFITQLWQVVALNILGGIIWGAFELASFNFLLHLIPPEQRARYSAIYQIVVTIALALGAAAGSSMVTASGYKAVFFVSGIGRLLTGFLFLFLWRSLEKKKQTA